MPICVPLAMKTDSLDRLKWLMRNVKCNFKHMIRRWMVNVWELGEDSIQNKKNRIT